MTEPIRKPLRLHLGVHLTKRTLWTMITTLDDEPYLQFRTAAGALRWLYENGYAQIEYRSGRFTGTMTVNYQPYAESEIIYHVDSRHRTLKGASNGEDNGPIIEFWSQRTDR